MFYIKKKKKATYCGNNLNKILSNAMGSEGEEVCIIVPCKEEYCEFSSNC